MRHKRNHPQQQQKHHQRHAQNHQQIPARVFAFLVVALRFMIESRSSSYCARLLKALHAGSPGQERRTRANFGVRASARQLANSRTRDVRASARQLATRDVRASARQPAKPLTPNSLTRQLENPPCPSWAALFRPGWDRTTLISAPVLPARDSRLASYSLLPTPNSLPSRAHPLFFLLSEVRPCHRHTTRR